MFHVNILIENSRVERALVQCLRLRFVVTNGNKGAPITCTLVDLLHLQEANLLPTSLFCFTHSNIYFFFFNDLILSCHRDLLRIITGLDDGFGRGLQLGYFYL